MFQSLVGLSAEPHAVRTKPWIENADWESWRNFLEQETCDAGMRSAKWNEDPERCWESLKRLLTEATNLYIPTIRTNRNSKPFGRLPVTWLNFFVESFGLKILSQVSTKLGQLHSNSRNKYVNSRKYPNVGHMRCMHARPHRRRVGGNRSKERDRKCCYLAKGAKRPSHTTNTIKFDRIPFDPCNSIKRFDLCPFDPKYSTYLQPPLAKASNELGL